MATALRTLCVLAGIGMLGMPGAACGDGDCVDIGCDSAAVIRLQALAEQRPGARGVTFCVQSRCDTLMSMPDRVPNELEVELESDQAGDEVKVSYRAFDESGRVVARDAASFELADTTPEGACGDLNCAGIELRLDQSTLRLVPVEES